MHVSQMLFHLMAAATCATATCLDPETTKRVCYAASRGATPQKLNMQDVTNVARSLRRNHEQAMMQNGASSPLWKMDKDAANDCAEWTVFKQGTTWAQTKLVGNHSAAVTLADIANTIDPENGPGTDEEKNDRNRAIFGCGTDGGQMGVITNSSDPIYSSKEFTDGHYINEGIVIKLIHAPSEDGKS